MGEPMSVQLRNLHDGVPCVCTCCGEPISLVDEVRRLRAERAVMLDVILAADALIDTPTDDDVEDTALVDALIAALVRFDELPGDDR